MTKQKVMIKILTYRQEFETSPFEESEAEAWEELPFDDGEPLELLLEGRLLVGDRRVELVWEESELTGMEGSSASLGFDRDTPGLVTMLRTGAVSTALVYERGKRHICCYRTPFSTLEVCSYTMAVDNRLLEEGVLLLDYIVEFHGAEAERCKMELTIKPQKDLFA